jgi:hypothetical protein
MDIVIGWQLQHGFYDERSFHSSYGKAQKGTTSTCLVLGYAIVVVHNCRKSKMCRMV